MKFKLTTILMLVSLMASVSVFTSCKDNCEDDYNEIREMLKNQDTKLTELLNEQIKTVKAEIATLKSQLESVKSCTCDPNEINQKITEALNKYAEEHPSLSKGDVTTLIANYLKDNNYLTKAEIDALLNKALEAYCKSDDCLDRESVIELINIYSKVGVDEAMVRELISKATANLATQEALQSAIDKLQGAIDGVSGDVKNVVTDINNLNISITSAKAIAEEAKRLAQANGLAIEKLQKSIDKLQDAITDANTEIGKVRTLAESTKAYAEALEIRIGKLEDIVKALSNTGEGPDMDGYYTKTEIDKILENYVTIEMLNKKAEETLKKATDYTDEHIKCFGKNVMEPKLQELKRAYEEADALLQAQIDDLKTDVGNIKGDIINIKDDIVTIFTDLAKIKDDINDIKNDIDSINNELAKLITSIELQGTENDAFGYFNTPIGIRSNILLAYYGEILGSGDIRFPSKATGNYVYPSEAFTEAEWNMINPAQEDIEAGTIFNDTPGNAGKVYFTINPNTVDFTGVQVSLVNSQDKESPAELKNTKLSDETLKFGFSRTANGFYEAQATISEENLENAKVDIESGWEQAAKDLLKKRDKSSIAAIGAILYNQFSGILDANAIKATWKDEAGNEHSVYSQYAVAAATIKPLSFAFAKDLNVSGNMPGYQQAYDLIDRIANRIKNGIDNTMPDFGSLEVPTIQRLSFDKSTINTDAFNITIDFTIESPTSFIVVDGKPYIKIYDEAGNEIGKVHFGEGTVTQNEDGSYAVTFYKNNLTPEVEKIFDAIESGFDSANATYEELEDYLSDVNELIGEFNDMAESFKGSVDDIKSQLVSYLDKVNSKFSIINRAKNIIQPTMVLSGKKTGTKILSQAKNYPTKLSDGTVSLYPTTYTAEILVPCYRKHIACVNVYNGSANAQAGDADCVAALNAFNAQAKINEVIGSDVSNAKVSVKKGLTYEIAYSAVDYSGKIVTKRYYVRY